MGAERVCCALACAATLLAGCLAPVGEGEPLQVGSVEVFAAEVQPVLAERCATGGCHGRPDRMLALYAPGQHRADPDRVYLDEPLTTEELWANAERLAAFAHGRDGVDSLALRKPLAIEAGGCFHEGGDVFRTRTDPGYRSIERWLSTRGAPAEGDR